jgi:hypothetical protein
MSQKSESSSAHTSLLSLRMLSFTSSAKLQNSSRTCFLYAYLEKEKNNMTLLHMHGLRQHEKPYKRSFVSATPHRTNQNIELSRVLHILVEKNTKNYDAIVNPMHPKFQHFGTHVHSTFLPWVKHWLKLLVYLQVAISPAQKTRQFEK